MDVELDDLSPSIHSSISPSSTLRDDLNHPARDLVLATPELLEAILIHLPLSELLTTAQLVSVQFHDTIYSSASLQQALFFLSSTNSHVSKPCPLLHHCGTSTFIDKRSLHHDSQDSDGDFPWLVPEGLQPLVWQKYAQRYKAYTVKGASWRRMLVVQPPIKELSLNGGNILRNDHGVIMGQLENCFMDWGHFVIERDGKASLRRKDTYVSQFPQLLSF